MREIENYIEIKSECVSVHVCEGEIEGEREIERMGEREREEIEREKLQVDGSNKDKR